MDLSLDALTLAGLLLIVLFVGLMLYLCNRRGGGCSDNTPPGGPGPQVL
jgi:hypothetical protein